MSLSCPKCGKSMAEGFILDEGHGTRTVSDWYPGKPVTSFWQGIKLKGLQKQSIQTFRCSGCGFLEQYAGR